MTSEVKKRKTSHTALQPRAGAASNPPQPISTAVNSAIERSPENQVSLTSSIDQELLNYILSFESVDELVATYTTLEWTPDEEITHLIDIIRGEDTKDKVRLSAIKALQQRRAEILENSGLLVHATRSGETPDGQKTILTAKIVAAALQRPNFQKQVEGAETNVKEKKTEEKREDSTLGKDSNADGRTKRGARTGNGDDSRRETGDNDNRTGLGTGAGEDRRALNSDNSETERRDSPTSCVRHSPPLTDAVFTGISKNPRGIRPSQED